MLFFLFTHNTPWTRTLVRVLSDPIFALPGPIAFTAVLPSGTGRSYREWRSGVGVKNAQEVNDPACCVVVGASHNTNARHSPRAGLQVP